MNKGLKVTILGSGTCVPSRDRSSCAVLMETGDSRLLFDIGPGTMRRLLEAGFLITDIDFLFVSHFHPDHTGELASFLFANKYPDPETRKNPLTLAGGPGFKAFYEKLARTWPGWLDLGSKSRLIEVQPGAGEPCLETEAFCITCAHADHQPESIAFRVSVPAGICAVYTGDTDFSRDIIGLAGGTDLLICEAALPDNMKVKGHMTPSLAGKTAAESRAGSLVLTHFYPECDEADIEGQCRRTYTGALCLARDLMKIELPGNKKP
ncbi:MAG: ribonuclease Z [Desulfobacteraceae bacterium]|nr:ribonuclease Z [Desulfobacteraceae bacterium]MCF8094016.1 ribonuclease Z [Desulfobacteraceae bacterium]